MISHMPHTAEPSLELSTVLQLHSLITRTSCLLATWGKYKGTPKVLTCSSPLTLITLHTLYKVSCQDLLTSVYEYLQKQ